MQAALFDTFGTVVDWRRGIAREVATLFERHGVTDIDPFAMADAWRARYAPSMAEVRAGRRPFVPLDLLHRENLEAALSLCGVDPAIFPSEELDALNLAWHRLDPWPDAIEGLTRIKTRLIVAPLSNGNLRLLLDMAKRAGLPWDAIMGAELVRAYKPDPEAYLGSARLLDLDPSEILMVAAHNDDLAAARTCGMRTAFVLRTHEHGPGQNTDLAPEQDWDFVAADLSDLAAQLGA